MRSIDAADLRVIDDPLMHKLLRRTVVTSFSLERLFRVLTDPAALTGQLPLMASLACQCFNNEYIYATTPIRRSLLSISFEREFPRLYLRETTLACCPKWQFMECIARYVALTAAGISWVLMESWKKSSSGKLPSQSRKTNSKARSDRSDRSLTRFHGVSDNSMKTSLIPAGSISQWVGRPHFLEVDRQEVPLSTIPRTVSPGNPDRWLRNRPSPTGDCL